MVLTHFKLLLYWAPFVRAFSRAANLGLTRCIEPGSPLALKTVTRSMLLLCMGLSSRRCLYTAVTVSPKCRKNGG